MNCVILSGRLTRDPDIRWTQSQQSMCVSHFTLAVDRSRSDQNGERQADFIRCVCFGQRAEWMEKYTHKGMKLEVRGRWQTGDYTDNNGRKVYTNDCICDEVNFGESKSASQGNAQNAQQGGYQSQGYQQTGNYGGGSGNGNQGGYGGYQQSQPAQNPQQYQGNQNPPQYQQQSMFQNTPHGQQLSDGFMQIPDDVDDEGLPFN